MYKIAQLANGIVVLGTEEMPVLMFTTEGVAVSKFAENLVSVGCENCGHAEFTVTTDGETVQVCAHGIPIVSANCNSVVVNAQMVKVLTEIDGTTFHISNN
jgi:hypothetical protein